MGKSASKTEEGLNQQQELFCQYYVNADRELFGNGTRAYIEAYDVDLTKKGAYMVAAANASRLLKNAKVIARVNELLETGGFNDENVDKQHLFLINQHADLKTKMSAIKEYNELKQRITKKLDITTQGEKIIATDEIKQLANELNELHKNK